MGHNRYRPLQWEALREKFIQFRSSSNMLRWRSMNALSITTLAVLENLEGTVARKCHSNFNLFPAISILLTAISICSRQFQFTHSKFKSRYLKSILAYFSMALLLFRKCIKYLGVVMIDESLSWKYHISFVCSFNLYLKTLEWCRNKGINYLSIQRINQIYYNLSSMIFLMV